MLMVELLVTMRITSGEAGCDGKTGHSISFVCDVVLIAFG